MRATNPNPKVANEVDQSSKQLIEQHRELAQYSGVTAAAYAQLDQERILRDANKSNQMAEPISRLTASQSRSEEAWDEALMPWKSS